MIIRCWGIVNGTEVEFSPVADRPGYWEGLAPRVDGLQEIEIWAENDEGARGHLQCTVQITYHTETVAQLLLLPFYTRLMNATVERLLPKKIIARYCGCRRAEE